MYNAFAIRQRSTGRFLPERRSGSGYTFDDPIDCVGSVLPRLFGSRRAANIALTCWLKGEWRMVTSTPDFWTGDQDYYPEPVKVENRKREDMEVIQVRIDEVSNA